MKRFKNPGLFIPVLLFIATFNIITGQEAKKPGDISKVAIHLYRDGNYAGFSQAIYTGEPYWGIAKIKIENGVYSEVRFIIRDSSLHETFSKKYEVHFKDNPVYMEQCRKDSKGAKKYPKKLYKTQDIDQVDVISGATWSYNIFKASVSEALKNAYNNIDSVSSH